MLLIVSRCTIPPVVEEYGNAARCMCQLELTGCPKSPAKVRKSGRLIWFHGASVGEIMSIIPIIID